MAATVLRGGAAGAAIAIKQGGSVAIGALIGAVVVPVVVLTAIIAWVEDGPTWFIIIGILLILAAVRGCT